VKSLILELIAVMLVATVPPVKALPEETDEVAHTVGNL
jgi:hypothetical protein